MVVCSFNVVQDTASLRPPQPTHLAPVPPPHLALSRLVSPSRPFSPSAPTRRATTSLVLCAPAGLQVGVRGVHVACTPRRWRRVHFAPVSWKSQVSDEAAERVVREELLALELEARRGRGVVGLEPLLDGAALVRMAVYLLGPGERR